MPFVRPKEEPVLMPTNPPRKCTECGRTHARMVWERVGYADGGVYRRPSAYCSDECRDVHHVKSALLVEVVVQNHVYHQCECNHWNYYELDAPLQGGVYVVPCSFCRKQNTVLADDFTPA